MRLDGLGDGVGNLLGHPLLHLQPPTVHLHDAGQLAQAEHLLVGQVADGHLPKEKENGTTKEQSSDTHKRSAHLLEEEEEDR